VCSVAGGAEGGGGDALCATLYAKGYGGCAPFAGRAGDAGGVAMCAAQYAGGSGGCALLLEVPKVPEVPGAIRCVLLRVLEVMEGALCVLELLEVPEVIRCVLLCMLEDVEGVLCLLEVVGRAGRARGDALCATLPAGGIGGAEVIRCVLLCMLEAVEGGLSFGASTSPLSPFSRYSPPPG